MLQVVLVIVVLEKLVSRSAGAAVHLADQLVLGCRIGDHLASIADESRKLVPHHPVSADPRGVLGERARRADRVAELVDFDDVWNELASRADPDHPESQHQRDRHHAGCGDLPVPFAKNEICVTLVPFLPRFEIDAAFHADASLLAIETLVVNSCSLTSGLEQVARQLRISGIPTYRSDRRGDGETAPPLCGAQSWGDKMLRYFTIRPSDSD